MARSGGGGGTPAGRGGMRRPAAARWSGGCEARRRWLQQRRRLRVAAARDGVERGGGSATYKGLRGRLARGAWTPRPIRTPAGVRLGHAHEGGGAGGPAGPLAQAGRCAFFLNIYRAQKNE